MNDISQKVQLEMSKSYVGRELEIELMLIALFQGGHVLLESVPGTGKTKLAHSFSKVIEGEYKRIQFTSDLLPSDISGIQYYNMKTQDFEIRMGPIYTNILLADEINRATPRTQASLLEAMEEKQVTIDGEIYMLPQPFMVIATQNPTQAQQGTFPLPFAQLDRFMFKLPFSYPTRNEELKIYSLFKHGEGESIHPLFTLNDLNDIQMKVRETKVSEDIELFILELVRNTRKSLDIEIGASPRAGLILLKAAQGKAFLKGRGFVIPEDVQAMVVPVLAHRILLSPEASLFKTNEACIEEVVRNTPVPVEREA